MTTDEAERLVDGLLALPHVERRARMSDLAAEQQAPLMRALQAKAVTPNPLLNFMGAGFIELDDDHSLVEPEITDNVRQQTGAVHALVLIAISAMAASVLARRASGGVPPLAVDVHASFVGKHARA